MKIVISPNCHWIAIPNSIKEKFFNKKGIPVFRVVCDFDFEFPIWKIAKNNKSPYELSLKKPDGDGYLPETAFANLEFYRTDPVFIRMIEEDGDKFLDTYMDPFYVLS